MTRSKKKNPFVANHLLRKMGERRELNPRMVDSQSTALIHLATSALILCILCKGGGSIPRFLPFHYHSFLLG